MASRVNRAAQYMPFDALKGLKEELKLREERRLKVEKTELTDEMIEEISSKLYQIEKNSKISITFFYNGNYVDLDGYVTSIDKIYKYLVINEEKIYFENIYSLKIISV